MNKERLINEFMEMVKINSITRNEGNFAKVLIPKLEALGFEVYVDQAGHKIGGNTGNVIGTLKGTKNVPAVLFGAHMDTVVPGENINPIIREGYIYSDGTTILGGDDKAGIAAILEAVRHIQENNIAHGDIEVAFTIAEEGGLNGAKNLDCSKLASKMGFILDGGGNIGEFAIQGPAQKKLNAKIIGKAAHAGVAPELGINAIQVAARAINNMKLLRIDNETTANIGIIKGGTATNIVCDSVDLTFEARSLKAEKLDAQINHMVDCINKACEDFSASCEIKIENNYPAFSIEKDSELIKLLDIAAQKIGRKIEGKSTGGGADTNIFNGNGLPSITLGIGMEKVHTTSERISIEDLVGAAELVASIIKEIK